MKVLLKKQLFLVMGFFMLLSTQICSAANIELTGYDLDTFVKKYNDYIDTMRQRNNNAAQYAKISKTIWEPDSKIVRYASVFDREADYVLIFELGPYSHLKKIECYHAVTAADESVEVAFRACCVAMGITDENDAYASMKRAESKKGKEGLAGEIYTDPMTGRQYRFVHPSMKLMEPNHHYTHTWWISPIAQLTPEEREQARGRLEQLIKSTQKKK